MESLLDFDSREQKLTFDLMEALTSSLDLSEVLTRAYEVLAKLLAADCAPICISTPGRVPDHGWTVVAMPPEDFVREALLQHPSLVLRDIGLGPCGELERSQLQQCCHELGMPLEHVMAVMLDVGHDWHGGFMLYRDRRHPFSERERAFMQRVTPLLTRTVRNCRMMREATGQSRTLEQLFQLQGLESIVVAPPATERMRTPGATALLEAWFKPEERGAHGLPTVLVERLELLSSGRKLVRSSHDIWVREKGERSLRVNIVPLPEQSGGRLWGLLLQEVANWMPVPGAWRDLLTRREVEVVECVLRGWDNGLIAEHLKCSLGTVKKHLQRTFDKLGVDSRAALIHKATRI